MKLVLMCILLALSACAGSKPSETTPTPSPTPELVLTTPREAAKCFVRAAQKKDEEMLAQCVAEEAVPEFQSLRNQEAPREDLEGLAQLMRNARVGAATVQGDRAEVAVELKSREETFLMIKTEAGWQLVDF